MNQREGLKQLIVTFCNNVKGGRTFTLQELHSTYKDYSTLGIGGQTPQATVRRLLQELRDEGFISFRDNSGHYTLRKVGLLDSEKEDLKDIDISLEHADKREYLIETYARSSQWVKQAKDCWGLFCMVDNCQNTFLKPDGHPYIEVHHIIPLYQGGEDGVWNLSVLCAHHHRMAHFAKPHIVIDLQEKLLNKTNQLLL